MAEQGVTLNRLGNHEKERFWGSAHLLAEGGSLWCYAALPCNLMEKFLEDIVP